MSYYVYIHEFPNGRRYIGATTSEPKNRWCSGTGYEGSIREAIEEFGWENIKHYIYRIPEDKTLMYALESFLIEYFDSTNPDKGYNKRGGGFKGFTVNEEAKQRMSESHIGTHRSSETKYKISRTLMGRPAPNRRKCVFNGVEYESITEAARQTGISATKIRNLLKGT